MSEQTLPPVAKSFFTVCKKCEVDRYHTVLAHTATNKAKMKCEVCGATKTYSLPKEGKEPKAKRAPSVRSATAKAQQKAADHQQEYEKHIGATSNKPESYSMKRVFKIKEKIDHPTFGLGVVIRAETQRVEVIFSDEVKTLVHNRT